MDDFYVYLPANVGSTYFENTSSNYKTKLAKFINLKGTYEVGLAEISYTFSFYNIFEDELFNIVFMNENSEIEKIQFKLNKGFYQIDSLIKSINNVIILEGENITLPKLELMTYKFTQKIKIINGQHKKGLIFLEMSENLCKILGINKKQYDDITQSILLPYILEMSYKTGIEGISKSDFTPVLGVFKDQIEYEGDDSFDIACGFRTIFVYCDIIKQNYVGDTLTQLLKFVQVPNNIDYGQQVHIIYDNIQYFPLIVNEFESIEIDIKDDSGMNIPFHYAKNLCVLHFRKNQ